MQINQTGIGLIKQFEGLRLKKYRCLAGYYTIGYGHVLLPNENLEAIDLIKAENLLQDDLDNLIVKITPKIQTKLNSNQFSALISFAYNVGIGSFQQSTLLRKVNTGIHLEVPQEFLKWIHINGTPNRGLLRRRCYEAALYMEY